MNLSSFIVLVITLLGSGATYGQLSSAESDSCTPKMAQMFVQQQVLESKGVTERPKRIGILLRAADFLWTMDPATSRAYYTEAYKTATEHFAEKGFERQTLGTDSRTYSNLQDLRTGVIGATAKHDPELAKKFTEQLFADYDKAAADRDAENKNREQTDLLDIAAANVSTNPELAHALFQKVMHYPLTERWFFSLYSAARQNQQFTDALYAEALQNYRNEIPSRLLFLSAYPFGRQDTFGQYNYRFSANGGAKFLPRPDLQTAFLDTFFTRVVTFTANPEEVLREPDKYFGPEAIYMSGALDQIEPIVVASFPDLLQRFSVARAQANSLMTDEMRAGMKQQDTYSKEMAGTFDERIKGLEEAEIKKTLTDYVILSVMYNNRIRTDKQFEQFEPWVAKITDQKVRADVYSFFWFLRTELAIKEDRLGEAEKMSGKVPEYDQRAVLLLEMARKQLDMKKDPASAFETLNSVSKVAHAADNSAARFQVLLSLARLYDKINHSVAMDELNEAIRGANKLPPEADIFQTWVTRQISTKTGTFMSTTTLPGSDLSGTFTELSKRDFEVTLANARAFDDRFFRTLAVISVATNCIDKKLPAKTVK